MNNSLFNMYLEENKLNALSILSLAHVGDAVYEILVRTKLCVENMSKVSDLHQMTVSMVNANAQAGAAKKIIPFLTDDEASVFRRGKNTKVNSVPHNSTISDYHYATGLEALFGWLYLRGSTERINELFNYGIAD